MPIESLVARALRIQLLLLDVDGVLTDGGLYYLQDGSLAVRFDVRDGHGIKDAIRAGLVVGLISGRATPQARQRAEELGVHEIRLGVADKAAVVRDILSDRKIDPRRVCYVGDDVIDLPAMELVGLPVAVADAVAAVRQRAAYVTERPGGRGAVREIVELILASRSARPRDEAGGDER